MRRMEEKAKLQSQLPKRRSRTSLEDARCWVFLEVPLLRGPRTGVHPQNSKVTIVNKRVSGPSCYSNVIASEGWSPPGRLSPNLLSKYRCIRLRGEGFIKNSEDGGRGFLKLLPCWETIYENLNILDKTNNVNWCGTL